MRKLKTLFALLVLSFFTIGNVWGQAAVGTTLFSENFGGYNHEDVPTGSVSSATNYRVIYGGGSVTYTCTNGAGSKAGSTYVTTANSGNLAGGTSPEIMVGKKGTGAGAAGGSFSIAGIPSGEAKEITVTYKQNAQNLSVSVSGTGYTGSISGKPTEAGERTFDITVDDNADATFTLTFQAATTSNVRVDDILVTVKTAAPSTDPSVTLDPTSINFGNVSLGASVATREITVLGEYLTSALTATSSNTDVFTVAVKAGDSLTPDGDGNVLASLVVTPITTAYGDFNGTITISGGGLEEDSIVPISMHVGGIVTVTPASPDLAFGEIPQDADAENYAKTITVSATNLTAYKEIRVQAPLYFQASPINISADENGVIEETEVKLMPVTTYDAGDYGDVDAKFELVSTSPREFAGIEIGAPTMTIVSCSPLDAPTLGTLSKSYDYANITWTAVEHTTEYIFTLTEHNGEPRTPLHTTNLGTEMLNLKANTQYDYTVQAVGDGTIYCESNPLLEGSFTTDDYPAATLTLSENGATRTWGLGLKLNSEIALPTAVAAGNEVAGKVLVGWSADEDRATAPELAKGANYTMNATAVTLYAVYATETPGEPSLTKMGSSYVPAEGDNLVIVAKDLTYALYQETVSSSYVKNWTFDNKVATVAADSKKYVTLESATDGKFYLGDETNGYVYSSGSNNLSVDASNKTAWTIAWDADESAFTFNQGRYLSCRSDLTGTNQYLFRLAGSTPAGTYRFDIYKYSVGETTYSGYTTSGAKAPTATVDPEEVEISAAALVGGLIDVTYENVNLANVTVALFDDAECTEAFDGGWLTASLDANKDIVYGAEAAVSYANVRTAYIKLTAPQTTGATDPAVVVIPVEQAKKDAIFTSLDDLVASDIADGDSVTITLSDVAIKTFYIYKEKRAGVTFDVQKAGNDIRIFKNDQETIVDWEVGGTLSGTFKAKWGTYNDEWQLSPAYSWAWANLTYKAPSATAIDNTEVEGKAVKLLRNGILLIEKNGHTYNAMGQLVK